MTERYAAELDAIGDVLRVIVIRPDADSAAEECAAHGIAGAWRDCPSLPGKGWRYHAGGYYPHWRQIEGADTGPEGAESGYPQGAEVWGAGAVRVSRAPFNVTEPSDTVATGWSRADGRYVVPAGWQYQPGEDLTEDGETWHRVTQATSFRPSESPAQFVAITGPGGEVVAPAEPEGPPPWQQPTGAHDAYPAGAVVTHNGATWANTHGNGNVWEPGDFGWAEQ